MPNGLSTHAKKQSKVDNQQEQIGAQRKNAAAVDLQLSPAVQRAQIDPSRLTPADVLSLQRSIGNRAVARLLDSSAQSPRQTTRPPLFVQPKLNVGPADDVYEQEADRVAQQVTRQISAPAAEPSSKKQAVQRDDEEQVQRQEIPEEEDDVQLSRLVQRTTPVVGAAGGILDDGLSSSIRQTQGSGSSLPGNVRSQLEPQLGADLSGVKVHTDSKAVQLNKDLGAKAFTHKNHIYYGAGQSPTDTKLTTHEVVHTIQQGAVNQVRKSDEQEQS